MSPEVRFRHALWAFPNLTQQRLRCSHSGALALSLQHRNQRLDRLQGVSSREFFHSGVALGTAARVAAYALLKRAPAATVFSR